MQASVVMRISKIKPLLNKNKERKKQTNKSVKCYMLERLLGPECAPPKKSSCSTQRLGGYWKHLHIVSKAGSVENIILVVAFREAEWGERHGHVLRSVNKANRPFLIYLFIWFTPCRHGYGCSDTQCKLYVTQMRHFNSLLSLLPHLWRISNKPWIIPIRLIDRPEAPCATNFISHLTCVKVLSREHKHINFSVQQQTARQSLKSQ